MDGCEQGGGGEDNDDRDGMIVMILLIKYDNEGDEENGEVALFIDVESC
jgi:hypothetical protein